MAKSLLSIFICLMLQGCLEEPDLSENDQILQDAYENQISDLQVHGSGVVIKLLPDDTDGNWHQKFILELDSSQTLLISHNMTLAPRVTNLSVMDEVEFYGEYEWNVEGGVVHWTHRDPGPVQTHVHGWLKHDGQIFE